GASGRDRVRRHFLIPRMVLDELSLMRRMAAGVTSGRAFEWVSHRDPVCGMAVEAGDETISLPSGFTLRFCSARCREAFTTSPGRYINAPGVLPEPIHSEAGLAP